MKTQTNSTWKSQLRTGVGTNGIMKMALKELKRDRWLYLMLLPGVLYF